MICEKGNLGLLKLEKNNSSGQNNTSIKIRLFWGLVINMKRMDDLAGLK